jgi:DUF1680 family protein
VDDLRLDPAAGLAADHRPGLLEGVTVVTGRGRIARHEPRPWPYEGRDTTAETPVDVTAVPYFAWANRGIGPMRVWLPAAQNSSTRSR